MKKKVDIDVLKESANKAIKRYPYFAVRVVVKDGAYQFVPNDKEIVVIPVKKKTPYQEPQTWNCLETNPFLKSVSTSGHRTIDLRTKRSIIADISTNAMNQNQAPL